MKSTLLHFVIVIVVLLFLPNCATMKDYQKQASDQETPLLITEYGQAGKTSSIGGVSYEFSYYNLSGKTIKYLNVSVTPFNLVGDVVSSATNGKKKAVLMQVGPIETDNKTSFLWENVWFNRKIVCIELNSIEISYTDGSNEILKKDELQKALLQSSQNDAVLRSCK
jgi:hypothetical protein